MQTKYYLIIIIIVFVGAYFSGKAIQEQYSNKNNNFSSTTIQSICDPTSSVCTEYVADKAISYRITGSPSALKKFSVEVQLNELLAESVTVKFLMRDMDMGLSEISLVKNKNNHWSRELVLPICSLSRNDWINQLVIEYEGRYWIIEFSFEQKN